MKVRQVRGFTLFEVILAIGLSAVVLMLVGMAIRVHMKATDTRRAQIEEAQLARAVLQRIADDLRGTVQYKPIDFSSVSALGGLDDLEGIEEGKIPDGIPGGLGGDLMDEDATEEETPDEEVADIAGQVAPRTVPGLYGNRYELQLDVSRLPRLDEYDRIVRGDGDLNVVDLPSDIKTVAYYVAGSNNTTSTTANTPLPSSLQQRETFDPNAERTLRTSLIRRSLDRAVTQYAIEMGDTDKLSAAGELLAPEVVAIEFRYSDGVEWFDEWNTASAGSLPVAVQVAIAIDMHAEERAELPDHTTSILTDEQHDLPQGVVYRLLVHLPAAEAPTEEEQLSDEELFP